MRSTRPGIRTSQTRGLVYIRWIKALKECLDEKRPVRLLRSVMPTQAELF